MTVMKHGVVRSIVMLGTRRILKTLTEFFKPIGKEEDIGLSYRMDVGKMCKIINFSKCVTAKLYFLFDLLS